MIKMLLSEYGIDILFKSGTEFIDTEFGIWLNENNIDCRMCEINEMAIGIDPITGITEPCIDIKSIYFFNNEDYTAFKLRWHS